MRQAFSQQKKSVLQIHGINKYYLALTNTKKWKVINVFLQEIIVVKNKELKFNILNIKCNFQHKHSPQSEESKELQAWVAEGQNIHVPKRENNIKHFIAITFQLHNQVRLWSGPIYSLRSSGFVCLQPVTFKKM